MLALLKLSHQPLYKEMQKRLPFKTNLNTLKKKTKPPQQKEAAKGIFYCALMNCKGYSLNISDVSKAEKQKHFTRNLFDF